MASESSHIAVANRNQAAINHLCSDAKAHSPWIATIAFYKALHIVEAVFARDGDVQHANDHATRFQILKRTHRYQQIYRHYSQLFRISTIARYLEDDGPAVSCFEDFMSPDEVETTVLFHHLKQVENSAHTKLSDPIKLTSVDTAKIVLEKHRPNATTRKT